MEAGTERDLKNQEDQETLLWQKFLLVFLQAVQF
jgi:hypothetical protein